MSGALLVSEPSRRTDPLACSRDEPTLDERVVVLWGELRSGRPAACPLCDASLAPRYGAHAAPVGGCCTGCGTTIA